uniref:Uncharacterized protein n=1 Tax=Panagrolaimus davidi TaxID=227884 RepID=A0A914Q4S1_9BILA
MPIFTTPQEVVPFMASITSVRKELNVVLESCENYLQRRMNGDDKSEIEKDKALYEKCMAGIKHLDDLWDQLPGILSLLFQQQNNPSPPQPIPSAPVQETAPALIQQPTPLETAQSARNVIPDAQAPVSTSPPSSSVVPPVSPGQPVKQGFSSTNLTGPPTTIPPLNRGIFQSAKCKTGAGQFVTSESPPLFEPQIPKNLHVIHTFCSSQPGTNLFVTTKLEATQSGAQQPDDYARRSYDDNQPSLCNSNVISSENKSKETSTISFMIENKAELDQNQNQKQNPSFSSSSQPGGGWLPKSRSFAEHFRKAHHFFETLIKSRWKFGGTSAQSREDPQSKTDPTQVPRGSKLSKHHLLLKIIVNFLPAVFRPSRVAGVSGNPAANFLCIYFLIIFYQ